MIFSTAKLLVLASGAHTLVHHASIAVCPLAFVKSGPNWNGDSFGLGPTPGKKRPAQLELIGAQLLSIVSTGRCRSSRGTLPLLQLPMTDNRGRRSGTASCPADRIERPSRIF